MEMTESINPQYGIPSSLPPTREIDNSVAHSQIRPMILNENERRLAIANSLRYFPKEWHSILGPEFLQELDKFGHIYMFRFRPVQPIKAKPLSEYTCNSAKAASIMLMIQNNLDPNVAQYPHELITYGGNGAVFQNWAQYLCLLYTSPSPRDS